VVGSQGTALVQVPRTGHKHSLDERYQIERKFGEAKQHHGLLKGCRYLGIWRHAIQAYLTAIALNLKRLVRLLAGVPFKGKVPIKV
jgi:hypothetical protein